MTLIPDWRRVLRRAWSVRLIVIAALLSGLEVALPLFSDFFPRGLFAVLSFLFTAAAFVARILAQKDFEDDP